jgi:aminoglycoside 3-N-acetyltransferase
VFDPATAEAARDHGRIPERVRTWPGAERSVHPEASMVRDRAARARADGRPSQDDGYGPDSPLGRLVAAGGDVLMLGAPLETLSILHHAEAIATAPGKRTVTFEIPVAAGGRVERRTYTGHRHEPRRLSLRAPRPRRRRVRGDRARRARGGIGVAGSVGAAACHLFPAPELVAFGVDWIDARFT